MECPPPQRGCGVKAGKVTADNGDTVSVAPGIYGTVLVTVRPGVGDAGDSVSVELDEVSAVALADMIAEARRSALHARAEAAMAP